MKNEVLILGLTTIAVSAAIIIYFGNKGVPVKFGPAAFPVSIN